MATRTIKESDISGAPDAESVKLAFGGTQTLEVDLTAEEQNQLVELLEPYISVARPVPQLRRRDVPETSIEERERMRAWARDNGYELSAFGRVPKAIRVAYDKAHKIRRPVSDDSANEADERPWKEKTNEGNRT